MQSKYSGFCDRLSQIKYIIQEFDLQGHKNSKLDESVETEIKDREKMKFLFIKLKNKAQYNGFFKLNPNKAYDFLYKIPLSNILIENTW